MAIGKLELVAVLSLISAGCAGPQVNGCSANSDPRYARYPNGILCENGERRRFSPEEMAELCGAGLLDDTEDANKFLYFCACKRNEDGSYKFSVKDIVSARAGQANVNSK